jgi:hypothetical protein
MRYLIVILILVIRFELNLIEKLNTYKAKYNLLRFNIRLIKDMLFILNFDNINLK